MSIKVDIYSGFLGAGKTSLIKYMIDNGAYNDDTIIIENEFGEISIDGQILGETQIMVKEINAGCICCEINKNFSHMLFEILDKYNTSCIIIEPSGVAKLSEIINVLDEIRFKDRLELRSIITVIDSDNFTYYLNNFYEFYTDQIKYAQKIILSRTENKSRDMLKNIKDEILRINRNALIFDSYKTISSKVLLNKEEKNIYTIKNSRYDKYICHKKNITFETLKIDIFKPFHKDELRKKFAYINEKTFGTVIRAKGVIQNSCGEYYMLNYVNDEFDLKKIKWSNRKCIQLIGFHLEKEKIINLFT